MNPLTSSRGGRVLAAAAAGLLVGGLMSAGVAQAAPPTDIGKDKSQAMKGGHVPEHPLPIAKKKAALSRRPRSNGASRATRRCRARSRRSARASTSSCSGRRPTPSSSSSWSSVTSSTPTRSSRGRPSDGSTDRRHRAAAQRDPRARPQRRQLDAVEEGLRRRALRGHVLQPDGEVLRDAVVEPLLGQGRRQRLGQGALQRGAATAATTAAASSATPPRPWSATRWRCGSQQQLDAGKSAAQIADYLKTFDAWDRYDLDGDGNFNEPDGYIDHMQVVHAGGDEAAGDPNQGTDAIWSHRWYAALQRRRPRRPARREHRLQRRHRLERALMPNNPTGVWVGDYTVQPENGGLGVFAHEYTHDLGLPGPLRHLRQHRWRRELDRLLDA